MAHAANDCPLAPAADALRALAAALEADDVDAAIARGLLDYVAIDERRDIDAASVCEACANRDRAVTLARDARLRALAARERFRKRERRLRERERARAEKRQAAATSNTASAAHDAASAVSKPKPALPPAAAAALARAKAMAAAKREGER